MSRPSGFSFVSNKLFLVCIDFHTKEKNALPPFLFIFYVVVARNPPADIRQVLASYEGCDIPEEFIRRSKEHQR